METKPTPVSVYAESTPNPATMKFVANKLLIENGTTVEYTTPEAAKESPIASEIFNFPFVAGVFIAGNFISVTKNNLVEWADITMDVREHIRKYLSSGKKIFSNPSTILPHQKGEVNTETAADSSFVSFEGVDVLPKTEIEQRIIELLEEYIRPAVEQDGGAIHFKSFDNDNGTLKVILRGSCSGCPSSTVTLKAGIQGLFARMLPEVKEVVAEET